MGLSELPGLFSAYMTPSSTIYFRPTTDAESDVHAIGEQEVTGSIPAASGNTLSWRLIMKSFYGYSLPSADSRMVVSFWRKNVHKY